MDNETPKKGEENTSRPRRSFDLAELEQITDDNIDFSALDEGIGFHPKRKQTPSNNESNSAAKEQSAEKSAANSKPTKSSVQGSSVPVKADRLNQLKSIQANNKKSVAETTQAQAKSLKQKRIAEDIQLATAWARTQATIIDLVLINIPIIGVFLVIWRGTPPSLVEATPILAMQAFLIFSYFVFTESLGGQSLGKFLKKIQVLENDRYRKPIGLRAAFTRTVLWMLLFVPACLSSFFTFWRSNYMAWHDKVSRSIVTRAD